MRYLGRITDWNDAKGFGFVAPNGGGDRAFEHVNAFERHGRRPASGDLIAYAVQRDAKGRLNAAGIRFEEVHAAREQAQGTRLPRKTIAGVACAALLASWLTGKLPVEVVFVYAVMSGIAVFLYAFDKSAARRQGQRTPENTLHAVALVGGWPGALVAQDLFRHKSRKVEFQLVFWITVALNITGLIWLLPLASRNGV